jgi:hypothetical protein
MILRTNMIRVLKTKNKTIRHASDQTAENTHFYCRSARRAILKKEEDENIRYLSKYNVKLSIYVFVMG